MKASTLITLAVALFLALGTAIGARALGLFTPGPGPAAAPPVIKVLVAKSNLYADIAINANQVTVRDLRSDEMEFYNKNREKFLPASPEAAALRIPTRNIEADSPILKTDLEDLAFPESVRDRLSPDMRAVNVLVPKERAAGGLITKGDYVDVYLTSVVSDSLDPSRSKTLGAFIARNLRVIVKRNSLWTVLKPNPENMPVAFTLEANPYRAALIEYALTKGTLSLLPSSRPRDDGIVPAASVTGPRSFSIADSREYREEDKRIDLLLKGEYSLTESDLERIFNLRPIERKIPPPPVAILNISGNQIQGRSMFSGSDGKPLSDKEAAQAMAASSVTPASGGVSVGGAAPSMGYSFSCPAGSDSGKTTDRKT